MFPTLSIAATRYSDTILYAFLRWIVMLEVFQNAWSFSVCSLNGRQRGVLGATAGKGSRLPYPWRKSERDHNDEHRLEDIFLDEVIGTGGPDDDYHYEDGTFQYLEDADDSFVARELESFDDGDVVDRGFPDPLADVFGP